MSDNGQDVSKDYLGLQAQILPIRLIAFVALSDFFSGRVFEVSNPIMVQEFSKET